MGWTNSSPIDDLDELIETLALAVAPIFDDIEAQIDQLYETESDVAFIERCAQAYKAKGYDRLQEAIFDMV